MAALAEMIAAIARGELDGAATAVRLRALAVEVEGGMSAVPTAQATLPIPGAESMTIRLRPEKAAALRLFEAWKRELDHPMAQPTPERLSKVQARLRDGYSEAFILRAIHGCARSTYHTGQNDEKRRYDDLTLICRNGSKLEQFASYVDEGAVPSPTVSTGASADAAAEIMKLEAEAWEHFEEGRHDEYNRTNARISALRSGGAGGR